MSVNCAGSVRMAAAVCRALTPSVLIWPVAAASAACACGLLADSVSMD